MASKVMLIFSMLFALKAWSQETASQSQVEFFVPEDVSQESVVPKMDSPQAVLTRALKMTNRFELSISQAWILDEPFLNSSYQILELSYHWNESFGVGLKALNFNAGTSEYSKQFLSTQGTQFDQVPNPKSGMGASFHNRIFYGKLSFSEETVLPTMIELVTDLGLTSQGSKSGLPFISLGVGQKTYFQKSFSFGLQYNWMVHQSLDANSVNLQAGQVVDPSSFKTKTEFSHGLQLNFGYLF
jgi:outer membrane beta-barrel protein